MSKKYTTNFLEDTNGSTGTTNQVLVSTATGVDWVDGSGSGIIGGPYLPLSAGSSYPLTGELLINSSGVKVQGAATDQYFIQGFRTGNSGNTFSVYDNGSTAYINSYQTMSFRANQHGGSGGYFTFTGGNVGIGTTSPREKLQVAGNTVIGNAGLNSYKTNLYLTYSAGADETWFRIYLPQDYASSNNGGTVKVRVLWEGDHATFGAYQEYQISYKTFYPASPYLKFSNVLCTNKTSDFSTGSTYYPPSSTPDVLFYDNTDGYLYVKVKGTHSTYNTARYVEAEIFGRTTAQPTIATTTAPSTPVELTKTIEILPQEGNLYVSNRVGIGTTSPGAKLHIGESGVPAQLWLQRTDGYNPVKLIGGTLADGNGFKITMNTSDAFAITSGGNVGIGVTSTVTNSLLNVAGGINTTTGIIGYNTSDSFTLNSKTQPHYGFNLDPIYSAPIGISGYFGIALATNSTEKMRITSAGGISFGSTGTAYGTSGQILKSNANASPTWVDASTVIGGPYLPLTAGGSYPLTGGLIGTSAGFTQGVSNNVDGLRLLNPGGGSNVGQIDNVTGAIKITLPVSWTNTMMRMTIKVYEYTTNESFTIVCGGYNYSPGTAWYNHFAYIESSAKNDRNFTVRFGHDGTKCCVYIGELASTWAYPQVFVTEFEAGYSAYTASTWNNGWGVGFEASAFGTITQTETNTQANNWARNGQDLYYGSGSGNVGIGTTTLTSSSGYTTLSISGSTGGQIAFQTSGTGKHYIYSSATDFNIYNSQAGNLKLFTNSTEKMRITSAGALLVGTTSTTNTASGKIVNRTTGSSNPDLALNGGAWSIASVGAEPALYLSSNIAAATGIPGATQTAKGGIGFEYVNAAAPTDIVLGIFGAPTVASSVRIFNNTERVRITSDGDTLIGNTVVNPASNFSNQKGFGYKFSTGQTEIATTADVPALTLGRNLAADGGILDLRKEGNVIGQFGSNTTGGQPLLDISAAATNGNMRFLTSGSERMRITSAGGISFGSGGTAYGTTGQVLTSAGNASPTWETPTTGDITAIVAGSGMTGTSLSGPIPTLNVIGGDGITANADDIQVDDTVARVYKGISTGVSSSAYKTAFTVNGQDLSSHIRFSVQGTANSVVISNLIDLAVNHYQDIQLTALSGNYTRLSVKVISNDNEDYEVQFSTDSTNAVTLYLEVFPLGSETIVFTSTSSFTGTTGTFADLPYGNYMSGTGGDDGDLFIGGDLTVNNGDILLNGTGRIQGVDTVSAGTDAANRDYVDNAVGGLMTGWSLDADTGSQTINNGEKVIITGGTGLTTALTVPANNQNEVTINLDNTAVTAGSYTNSNITVDAQGRITTASNGTDNQGVTSIVTTNGITGGTITTTGTLQVDSTVIRTTGDQTIGGTKTFSSTIIGSINGNAATADKLTTARNIAGVSFNGSADISLNNNAITNGAGYTTNTGTMTSFGISADSGTAGSIVEGETLDFNGSTGITTYISGNAPNTISITNDDRGSSQNIFKNVAVSGQSTVEAETNNDTLTLVAGTGLAITTNALSDTITFSPKMNVLVNSSINQSTNVSTNWYYLPMATAGFSTTKQYYDTLTAPFTGYIRTLMLRGTGNGTATSATTIELRVLKNGTVITPTISSSLAGTGTSKYFSISLTPTQAIFGQTDRLEFQFKTNSPLYNMAFSFMLQES